MAKQSGGGNGKGGAKSRAQARPDPSGPASDDIGGRIVDAAMRLAAEKGWRNLTLADIAAAAAVPLADVYRQFQTRSAVLEGLRRRADRIVMEAGPVTEGPARDRLFEVLMRRFDALERWRPGLASVLEDQSRDPVAMLGGGAGLVCSMASALETAGLDSSGFRGLLRAQALAAVWLPALRAWLGDESEDHARTMAALDTGLRRLERVARVCRAPYSAKREPVESH
jgi:AcrR family transcriptional regulator